MRNISRIAATLFLCCAAFGVSGCGGSSSAGVPLSNDAAARTLQSSSPVHNFRFMAVGHNSVSGDNMIVGGDGRFGPNQALGSGSYTQFHPVAVPPASVITAGTFHVTQFVSFTPAGTFGALEAGVLTLKVNLLQSIPNHKVIPATLIVYCNIAAAALMVGHPEGIKLVEATATFETVEGLPAATGFSAGPE
jgi:hypothetical protein